MTHCHTLLIEIGTEELPPTHLRKLSSALVESIGSQLQVEGFRWTAHDHFVTPRRIAARFTSLTSHSPERHVQRKGPAWTAAFDSHGAPTSAALGFAKSCHTTIEQLVALDTPQGKWLVFDQHIPGQPLEQVLPKIIESTLMTIPTTKCMRWGSGDIAFLRPIHWIACLHGTRSLSMEIFGIQTDQFTRGHRFHAPAAVALRDADHYVEELRELFVMVNPDEREQHIMAASQKIAHQHSGQAVIDPELLDQIVGLVEWPVVLYAHFDRTFLAIPQEALITSMQHHQKCFPIQNTLGKLLPTFILVSNTEPASLSSIIDGNERVMHARLSDAKFFFEQDQKISLETRRERLKTVVFQKKLGSVYEKTRRVTKLASYLASAVNASPIISERAAKLYKADLLTEMVFEFPELQGIIGYYSALHDGEPDAVAHAIRESYLPRFAKDILPTSPAGIALALADRLDSLVGIFGIGQIPTGDKDPYALRRQALAVVRILIEKNLSLDLFDLCHVARQGYGALIDEEVVPQVVTFCLDRLRVWSQEQGASSQTVDAILTNVITEPYDCHLRILAVSHFQTLPEAEKLAHANKRAKNILQKSGVNVAALSTTEIFPELLIEPSEKTLHDVMNDLHDVTEPLIAQRDYQNALIALASLQQPVDNFFDSVMVMTEEDDLRQNRVALLCRLCALFGKIADISRLAI